MLDNRKIEQLTERVVNRITKANTRILKAIGEQIAHIGTLTPTKAQELVNMLKYGGKYEELLQELSKITGQNIKDIEKIFEEVAKHNLNFNKEFYEYRNKPFIPYDENPYIQGITKAYTRQAIDGYVNLSRTLGFSKVVNGRVVYSPIRERYIEAIDEAILNVRTGQDFTSAMRHTVEELGNSGIRTVDYDSGYSRRLDSAVRQNIHDGIVGMHNTMQEVIGEEVGADGVEISHHRNAAPDHIDTVDGKQFTLEEFEVLDDSLERPVGTLNCRHLKRYIILEITPPRWTKEQLKKDKQDNEDGFMYKGKHYTNYEGTQLQRRIETEVRKQRDIQSMGNAEASSRADKRIKDLMKQYNDIHKISGLETRMERLR